LNCLVGVEIKKKKDREVGRVRLTIPKMGAAIHEAIYKIKTPQCPVPSRVKGSAGEFVYKYLQFKRGREEERQSTKVFGTIYFTGLGSRSGDSQSKREVRRGVGV